MIYSCSRKQPEYFLRYFNEIHTSIKFEWKISKHKVSFLHCDVIKENKKLKKDVYQIPTDCHPYLDYKSAHPSHFKTSIPTAKHFDSDASAMTKKLSKKEYGSTLIILFLVVRPGFHYTTNAMTTTQKQSDYRVEQSSVRLITLF